MIASLPRECLDLILAAGIVTTTDGLRACRQHGPLRVAQRVAVITGPQYQVGSLARKSKRGRYAQRIPDFGHQHGSISESGFHRQSRSRSVNSWNIGTRECCVSNPLLHYSILPLLRYSAILQKISAAVYTVILSRNVSSPVARQKNRQRGAFPDRPPSWNRLAFDSHRSQRAADIA